MPQRLNLVLWLLLAVCVTRLWMMELPSSFWLDEMATVFVAEHGAADPTLGPVAPEAWKSLYYKAVRYTSRIPGPLEVRYRLLSALAMAGAVFLVGRLAAQMIHPEAAWFAVFACFALKGINYHAADARPYALGMAVAAAGLWFLLRWLDTRKALDLALVIGFGALLWRIHLTFWPFYLVLGICAWLRAGWVRSLALAGLLTAVLWPVAGDALALAREAGAHQIVAAPTWREAAGSLKLGLMALSGGGAWLVRRCLGSDGATKRPVLSGCIVIAAWWLCQPICFFAISRLGSASVFVPRYLSLSLPGAALASTVVAAWFMPVRFWRPLALALGLGALLFLGQWRQLWPLHHNSDWRAAAAAVNEAGGSPVVCPSPFIEAKTPVWQPGYPLESLFYCHLLVYPVHVKFLFPFETSPEAERYARSAVAASGGRFLIYGWEPQVHFWRDWLGSLPELSGWKQRRLGPFADVDVWVFEDAMR